MSLLQQAPRFDPAGASKIAREVYGLEATATQLASERDQNFLLEVRDGGRFVLKIANGADDRALLEAQNAAMSHAGERTGLCPGVVAAAGGTSIVELDAASGRHLVRLLTWIPGRPLGELPRHSPALLEDLGRSLGILDAALGSFDHPAIHRDLHWDLTRGVSTVQAYARLVADPSLRGTIDTTTAGIERRLATRLPRLRRASIHNDANDYNVLAVRRRDSSSPLDLQIAGFIDFGDMVHGLTVADLAIAIAYAVLDKPDPMAAAVPLSAVTTPSTRWTRPRLPRCSIWCGCGCASACSWPRGR